MPNFFTKGLIAPGVKECSPPKTKGNFLLSNKILFMFSICLRASIIFFLLEMVVKFLCQYSYKVPYLNLRRKAQLDEKL